MKIIAVIPARIGSKGIPKKNIQLIGKKPLIQYSIESAKKSKVFDKILVSTDSKQIAKVAKSLGAEVPFIRPKRISGSYASVKDVIKHTVNFLAKNQSYFPDIITILQPTSPFRDIKIIKKSISSLQKTKATSVITVSELKKHPYKSFSYNKNFLKPFKKDFEKYESRQKIPKLFYHTGSVYSIWTKNLKKYNSIFGPRIKPIKTSGILNIDIDDSYDLEMARLLIRNKKLKY